MNARLHAIVEGYVQGVGFRQTTAYRARRLGLTGWVKNRDDGSVETIAEGPRDDLEAFVDFLNRGPQEAEVANVHAEWLPATGEYREFRIQLSP